MKESSLNTNQLEQLKADFMEHMYRCSGRTNGLFTGLWKEFCLKEAGPYCRELWRQKQDAIKQFVEHQNALEHFQKHQNQQKEAMMTKELFIPTLHD